MKTLHKFIWIVHQNLQLTVRSINPWTQTWTALVCLLLGGVGMPIYLSITSLATKPFSKFLFSPHIYTRNKFYIMHRIRNHQIGNTGNIRRQLFGNLWKYFSKVFGFKWKFSFFHLESPRKGTFFLSLSLRCQWYEYLRGRSTFLYISEMKRGYVHILLR